MGIRYFLKSTSLRQEYKKISKTVAFLLLFYYTQFFHYPIEFELKMIQPVPPKSMSFDIQHKKMLKEDERISSWRFIRSGRITERQCLTTSGFRRSGSDVFFPSYPLLSWRKVESQARRVSYRPSTVKSSSSGGPEFTPRTSQIALGIVQTCRDVLSCKRSRKREKMCRWKSPECDDTEDRPSVTKLIHLLSRYFVLRICSSRCTTGRNIWIPNFTSLIRYSRKIYVCIYIS